MEIIKGILSRFWHSGALFIGGFLLIMYIALGILYGQQGMKQREYQTQITQLSAVVARPMDSGAELRADYEEVNRALAPIAGSEAVAKIVGIAQNNGINIEPAAGKLRIPPVTSGNFKEVKMGADRYRVLSIRGIRVQDDDENVMDFISDVDLGEILPNMVLKKITITEVEARVIGDAARIEEFNEVITAVQNMMAANGLTEILNPISTNGTLAVNLMGDDRDTVEEVEGFPNITTTAAEKGYTGTGFPRDGYVLYGHDRVLSDNTTLFVTDNYTTTRVTKYYYTCEINGTVRQFDGADLLKATEHLIGQEFKMETVALVDIDIYMKLE